MKKNIQSFHHQGFTLIELMIVVAIIAILASIAIPTYQDYLIRSQVSEGASLTDGYKTEIVEYYSTKRTFPSSNASIGLVAPNQIKGKYVTSVDVSNGKIVATFGGQSNPALVNETLVLSAVTNAGSISWNCKGGSIPNKYLPSSCRN